ncbi:ELMO domain-containing protein A isoform X4 [Tanacetum coccineum]
MDSICVMYSYYTISGDFGFLLNSATAMVGPRTWIGGIFNRTGPKRSGSNKHVDNKLTPNQETQYQRLQERSNIPYDEMRVEHQKALSELWKLAYPNVTLTGLISEQWKEMGWQGANPSTDIRGSGFLSLENLLFFAKTFPEAFRRLLLKQRGVRATWEYPFAIAGINITFMLTQMLEFYQVKPKCEHCVNFVRILGVEEDDFAVLLHSFRHGWMLMLAKTCVIHGGLTVVLQAVRSQLEKELALEDLTRIRDLPAFNLLHS